jgi:hypothetical protein
MTPEMKAYLQMPDCPAPRTLDIDGPVPELKSQIDILVDRFLSCPLPDSVCADLCATRQGPGRVGTNLLSGTEAKEVLSKVLTGCHITL